MSDGASIEILGQKLSYPTSWPGVFSVFFVCAALVLCVYLFDGEKIKATSDAFYTISEKSREQTDALDKANKLIAKQQDYISNYRETIIFMRDKIDNYERNASLGDVDKNKETFSDWKVYLSSLKPQLDSSRAKVDAAIVDYSTQLKAVQEASNVANKVVANNQTKFLGDSANFYHDQNQSYDHVIAQLDEAIKVSESEKTLTEPVTSK